MMQTKGTKRFAEGRAQYFGYKNPNRQEEGNFWKKNNNIAKKNERHFKDKILEGCSRENINNRKWNVKSETASSSSSIISISSRFRDRIEKACSTYSASDFKKEIFLLKREIERLQKEILKRDKIIFQTKNSNFNNKQSEAELFEAYRAVNFYEGKIKQMEFQIEKFRETILKGENAVITNADLSPLFDELRKQNEELQGNNEQLAYNLKLNEEKCLKYESKVFELKRQLTSVNRKYLDPLQKNMTQRFDRMFEMLQKQKSLDVKQKLYFHQFGEKLKDFQEKNQTLKVQIEVMKNELEDKNIQITLLHKENFTLKKSQNVTSEKALRKFGNENQQNFQNKRKSPQLNLKQNSEISSISEKKLEY